VGWQGDLFYSVVDVIDEVMLMGFTCEGSGGFCYSFDCSCIYGSYGDGTILGWDAESGTQLDNPFTAAGELPRCALNAVLAVCSPTIVIIMWGRVITI
jgi:hypothetical protein